MSPTTPDPQLTFLLDFLGQLSPFGIEWRLSPNGALLQRKGRMVAMVLLVGTRLTVSPVNGEDQYFYFDLEIAGDDERAVELIRRLKRKTWLTETPATDRERGNCQKQLNLPA